MSYVVYHGMYEVFFHFLNIPSLIPGSHLFQNYFSRGGAQFVGMIISPYNSSNSLPYSQVTCLIVSEELSADGSFRKYGQLKNIS